MSTDTKRPRGVRKSWASADMQESIASAVELANHQAFEARVLRLLIELEEEGMLTEGQCAEVWGGDRLDWRMASRPIPPAFGPEP